LVVTGGGGGDGAEVFGLGIGVLEEMKGWRGVFATGPYADVSSVTERARRSPAHGRLDVHVNVDACGDLFAQAGAVVQMAGYNSTFEALVAGCRPVLVPRRQPRREQLIRATRLAELDLADVVAEDAEPADVVALLRRPRRLGPHALDDAGIDCHGAERAASLFIDLADAKSAMPGNRMEVAG